MNNNTFFPESIAAQDAYEGYGKRSFRNVGDGISGRSVVIEREGSHPMNTNGADSMWPYSLTDYLKGYIGSMVLAEYVSADSMCSKKRGRLNVVGIDFIGIQACRSSSLSLLGISSLKNIEILDCDRPLRKAY